MRIADDYGACVVRNVCPRSKVLWRYVLLRMLGSFSCLGISLGRNGSGGGLLKKVGIVADNYKLDRFKKELTKGGFSHFEIKPFTEETSAIFISVLEKDVRAVNNICTKVETHFKRSN